MGGGTYATLSEVHFPDLDSFSWLTMMMKLILVAATLLVSASSAYVVGPAKTSTSIRQTTTTQLFENFGLGVGEDTYENQPKLLGGEAEYKQWVGKFNENAFVNRQVRFISYHLSDLFQVNLWVKYFLICELLFVLYSTMLFVEYASWTC